MNLTAQQILLFFLILVRFTAMFAVAPVFSIKGIPNLLKIGMGCLLAMIVFPLVQKTTPDLELNLVNALILVFGEILTGITIGMVINFLFVGVQMAGEYIGVDMGFAMAQEFDPMFQQQVSIIARLNNILAMLFFVLIDGHHFLIEAVVHSFRLLPVGTWNISGAAIQKIMEMSSSMFVIGIKIAAPAIVTLFLVSVAMGITARAVPQMNIFFVGFPLRISTGLFSLVIAFPLFFFVFSKLLNVFEKDILYLLQVM
ncbi:MAG: flagellar biosynthetic protein FliR [Calditrichia bacterium]